MFCLSGTLLLIGYSGRWRGGIWLPELRRHTWRRGVTLLGFRNRGGGVKYEKNLMKTVK